MNFRSTKRQEKMMGMGKWLSVIVTLCLLITAAVPFGVFADLENSPSQSVQPQDASNISQAGDPADRTGSAAQSGFADLSGSSAQTGSAVQTGSADMAEPANAEVHSGTAIPAPATDAAIVQETTSAAVEENEDDLIALEDEEESVPDKLPAFMRGFTRGVGGTYSLTHNSTYKYNTANPDPSVGQSSDYPAYPAGGSVVMTKGAEWDDLDNSKNATLMFELFGKSRQEGADVILVIDTSNSMGMTEDGQAFATNLDPAPHYDKPGMTSRLTLAKNAAKSFLDIFFNDPSVDNRLGIINFGTAAYNASNGFQKNKDTLKTVVDGLDWYGGTNYTFALQKAIDDFAAKRSAADKKRPLFVVFMSDGKPDPAARNGQAEANKLKGSSADPKVNGYDATFYAIGFTNGTAAGEGTTMGSALGALASSSNYLFTGLSGAQLETVFRGIAGEISTAGTSSVLTDKINTSLFDFRDLSNLNGNFRVYMETVPGSNVFGLLPASRYTVSANPNGTFSLGLDAIRSEKMLVEIDLVWNGKYTNDGLYPTNDGAAAIDYKNINGKTARQIVNSPVLEREDPALSKITDFKKNAVHSNFANVGNTVSYEISFKLPQSMSRLDQLRIDDLLPTGLAYKAGTLNLTAGGKDITKLAQFGTLAGKLSYTINAADLAGIAGGTEVSMKFDCAVTNLWQGGDLTNNADIYRKPTGENFPTTPEATDSATVSPLPPIENFVKGAHKATFTGNGDVLSYDIIFKLPQDVTRYEKIRLEDTMPNTLSYNANSLTVTIGSTVLSVDPARLSTAGGKVGYTLTEAEIKTHGGESVTMTLSATVTNWVKGDITNEAKLYVTPKGDLELPSPTTSGGAITPPLPKVEKFRKEAIQGASFLNNGDVVGYEISFKLPQDVNLYEQLRIVDLMPNTLSYITNTLSVSIGGNPLQLDPNRLDTTGGNVSYTITASELAGRGGQIVSMVLTTDIVNWVSGDITNDAELYVTPKNGTEPQKPTEEATEIIPPVSRVTAFSKDAKQDFFVGNGSVIDWDISIALPQNVSRYEKVRIVDEMPNNLSYKTGSLAVKIGNQNLQIDQNRVDLSGGNVSYIILDSELAGCGGQKIVMSLSAEVVNWTTDDITNKAKLYVTPPGGTEPKSPMDEADETVPPLPKVTDFEKNAQQQAFSGNGSELTWDISFKLPRNVNHYAAIRIEDEMPSTLTYKPNSLSLTMGSTQLPVDPNRISVSGGKVSYKLTDAELAGHGDETVKMTLTATVGNWVKGDITNKANLYVTPKGGIEPKDPTEKTDETVPSTPTPKIEDFVKKSSKATFAGNGDVLDWNISFKLPKQVDRYEKIRIEDEMPSTLTYNVNSLSLTIGSTQLSVDQSRLSVSGNKVGYTLTAAELKSHDGETVTMALSATVGSWASGDITNKAKLYVTPAGEPDPQNPIEGIGEITPSPRPVTPPVEPPKPVDPTPPVVPVIPVVPTPPVDPVTPVDPTPPVVPMTPVDPPAPVEPVNPGNPPAPVAPVNPGNPQAPVVPVSPVNPPRSVDPPVTPAPASVAPVAPAPSASEGPSTPAPQQAVQQIQLPVEKAAGNLFADLLNGNVPLGGLNFTGGWSLLSLLMSLVAIIVTILLLLGYLHRRRDNENTFYDEEYENEDREDDKRKYGRLLKSLTIIVGILTPIIWLLLDNLNTPMVWINRWTVVVAIFFLLHLVLLVCYKLRKHNERDEEEDYEVYIE